MDQVHTSNPRRFLIFQVCDVLERNFSLKEKQAADDSHL